MSSQPDSRNNRNCTFFHFNLKDEIYGQTNAGATHINSVIQLWTAENFEENKVFEESELMSRL
jgi:hypothetical protein